jgi:hypothetical protein
VTTSSLRIYDNETGESYVFPSGVYAQMYEHVCGEISKKERIRIKNLIHSDGLEAFLQETDDENNDV